ncbi:hypothetical protein EV121DRAFT_271286 [Schizophyllum commune]
MPGVYSDALAGVQTESPEARVQLLDVEKRWEQRQRAVIEDSRRPNALLSTPRGEVETIRAGSDEVLRCGGARSELGGKTISTRKPWSMHNSEMGTHGKYDTLEAREEVRGWSYTLPPAQSRVTRRIRHQFMRHVGAAMRTVGGGGRIYVFLLRAQGGQRAGTDSAPTSAPGTRQAEDRGVRWQIGRVCQRANWRLCRERSTAIRELDSEAGYVAISSGLAKPSTWSKSFQQASKQTVAEVGRFHQSNMQTEVGRTVPDSSRTRANFASGTERMAHRSVCSRSGVMCAGIKCAMADGGCFGSARANFLPIAPAGAGTGASAAAMRGAARAGRTADVIRSTPAEQISVCWAKSKPMFVGCAMGRWEGGEGEAKRSEGLLFTALSTSDPACRGDLLQ